MKSPICEMLGIAFPLLAFSHCRDVVAAVSRAGWATVGKSGRARQCEQQSGYDTGQETHAAATLGRLGCGQRLLISRIELTPPVVGTSAPRQEVFWRSLARTNHGSNTRRDV